MSEPLKLYQTAVYPSPEGIRVQYYQTTIVTFTDTHITLDTGDWWTRSTQTRMNQVSKHFDLGYRVRQKGGKWYVHFGKELHPFAETPIRLDRNTGTVSSSVPVEPVQKGGK